MQLSDEEWRRRLSKEQFHVLREKGTEPPFTGKLLYNDQEGNYACAACGNMLFSSTAKVLDESGWPNFYKALPGSVSFSEDTSHGMIRTEVTCAKCGGHLGHVFDDAPDQPTGKHFCINSAAIDFIKKS